MALVLCTAESQKLATVALLDQESAPLLQWLDSMTKQNEGKRVERAKGKEPGVSAEQLSEAREKIVERRRGVPSEAHTRA